MTILIIFVLSLLYNDIQELKRSINIKVEGMDTRTLVPNGRVGQQQNIIFNDTKSSDLPLYRDGYFTGNRSHYNNIRGWYLPG